MKFTCIKCKATKPVKWESGRRHKDGTKIYIDVATRRRWVGPLCPECKGHKIRVRPLKVDDLGPEFNPNPLTNRRCRKCSVQLRQSQYFHCFKCQQDINTLAERNWGSEEWGYSWVRSVVQREGEESRS
jgi:Zn finger protein HypA/HybF involved in hydrogenase expression